ncbi:MAG: class I SAM-dependent methyltransferase [Acidimicrobiia bacterium]|jgi:cyclopropane-fatty-acyl-phospholipid synthase
MDPLELSHDIYRTLVRFAGPPVPAMRAWDGTTWGPDDAAFTVVLRHPGALRALLLPPSDLTAGEAYINDDVDLEGDIFAGLEFAARLESLSGHRFAAWQLQRRLRRLPEPDEHAEARPVIRGRLHGRRRDRRAVTHHYDTGNDFFRQFLGPDLVYSCAAFLDPEEPLEVAQRRKLDLVCRKLELEPGMRLLDVGCGWGALVRHAAAEYGVEAVGITLSGAQADVARRRIDEAGLANRVVILQSDYREVEGTFDAIASIGMVEHVGERQLRHYFRHLHGLLTPEGQLLNHGITSRDRSRRRGRNPTFVSTYVFPDGELVPIERVIAPAERVGFEVRDLESLRLSYARTLRHWVANLQRNREAAVAASSEKVYRIWRVYMAGSAVAFERGGVSVYQALLSKPDRPWRYGRRHLLAADDG